MAVARDDLLFEELRRALRNSERPVQEIEVGTELSIALGRRRTAVSCGGCSTPLTFEDLPVRTVATLRVPFRLVTNDLPVPGS